MNSEFSSQKKDNYRSTRILLRLNVLICIFIILRNLNYESERMKEKVGGI